MNKSSDNLKEAFAGESMANRKYLAFAEKADKDGFPQVARLFRAAAAAETVHAHAHLRALDGLKSTAENLQAAIQGENYEATVMYPGFVATAQGEDAKRALLSFARALEAEKGHELLYREALSNLGKEQAEFGYYICPICGFTHAANAPDVCPVCGAPASSFMYIQ
jgi:rubrerythrin